MKDAGRGYFSFISADVSAKLRLRKTDDVLREAASAILAPVTPSAELDAAVTALIADAEDRAPATPPAHRALADAEQERQRWLRVVQAARARTSPSPSG